jgi:Cupin superfamily protein
LRQPDIERLMAELRGGASIVWDSVDRVDAPMRAIKHALERTLASFVFVNLYASFGTTFGFGEHWDDHDFFVLQLAGRKRWRICRPTRQWPLPGEQAPIPRGRRTHDWTLLPGSVMYLPRGWWHRVTPVGEPSLHLTIGVLRATNVDLLRWLLEKASAVDLLRQDLRSGLKPAERRAHAKALRVTLEKWISADGIEAYERARAASQPLNPRPSLQVVAAPDAITWDQEGQVQLLSTCARLDVRDGHCVLHVSASAWPVPTAGRRAMRALIAGEEVRLGSLLETVGPDLVSDLVTAGVLAVS